MITRRDSLKALGAGTLAWFAGGPALLLAPVPSGRRLVCVFLRGGLDGLSAVPAYGDPAYWRARSGLEVPSPGDCGGALGLGGFFALHPQLANLHAMYRTGECVVLHAAGFPCPERSHFAAQNAILNGAPCAHSPGSEWLDLALESIGASKGARRAREVIAAFPSHGPVKGDRSRSFVETAKAVGASLSRADGPSAAMIDMPGWDTHANQMDLLSRSLRQLDQGLAALKASLGPAWRQTVVLVFTEFGRAVAMNEWRGTDHGAASAAFALGGAVRGGRVIADWPGLTQSALHEGRDLRPTTDLRSLFKAALIAQFGVSESVLETNIFADSRMARPLDGLFA